MCVFFLSQIVLVKVIELGRGLERELISSLPKFQVIHCFVFHSGKRGRNVRLSFLESPPGFKQIKCVLVVQLYSRKHGKLEGGAAGAQAGSLPRSSSNPERTGLCLGQIMRQLRLL